MPLIVFRTVAMVAVDEQTTLIRFMFHGYWYVSSERVICLTERCVKLTQDRLARRQK
jgi:hypothetical protein